MIKQCAYYNVSNISEPNPPGCAQFVVTSSGGIMIDRPEVLGMYHLNNDLYSNGKVTYQKVDSYGSDMYVFSFPYGKDDAKWGKTWTVSFSFSGYIIVKNYLLNIYEHFFNLFFCLRFCY